MSEFLEYFEYARAYIFISLGIIALTFIIHFLFKKYKIAKYVPGLILIPIGLFGVIRLFSASNLLDGVTSLMIFIIGIGGGLVGLLTGLIIGIYTKEVKLKRSKA